MAKLSESKFVTRKHQARLDKENNQRRWIRVGTGIVIFLIVGLILFGLLDQFVLKENRAVATVNGQKVSLAEFKTKVRFNRYQMVQQYMQTLDIMNMFGGGTTDQSNPFYSRMQQLQSQLQKENAVTVGKDSLDQLIADAVISQEAKVRGISVTDQEVDKYLKDMFNYYPDGTPTPAPTAKEIVYSTLSPTQIAIVPLTATPTLIPTLTATLQPTEAAPTAAPTAGPSPTITLAPTPYTEEGYKKQLQDTVDSMKKDKLTETELRVAVKSQLLREKVTAEITAEIKHEEEQVWARHILAKDEVAAKMVLDKLNAGGDWVKLAAEYSTDTSNKDKGGDLGWFGKGKMVAAFEKMAFEMKVGEISSAPVKTDFGFHIIQVIGHEVRPLSQTDFDTLKNTKFNEWLQTQMTADKVVRNDFWQNEVPSEPVLPAGATQ